MNKKQNDSDEDIDLGLDLVDDAPKNLPKFVTQPKKALPCLTAVSPTNSEMTNFPRVIFIG